MQPLNYCRQFISYTQELLRQSKVKPQYREEMSRLSTLLMGAQKFMLPENGVYLDDPQFTALDADMELHLPYDVIALEYSANDRPGGAPVAKNILLCVQEQGRITFHPITNFCGFDFVAKNSGAPIEGLNKMWRPYQAGSIQTTNYRTATGWRFSKLEHSFAELKLFPDGMKMEDQGLTSNCELLLLFLNTLACSNVSTEAVEPRKQPKASKGVLPFDAYHVLKVQGSAGHSAAGEGSHNSPREHLRRGHIRRLPTGKKIWINAVIVNAGIGTAVVKDYAFK